MVDMMGNRGLSMNEITLKDTCSRHSDHIFNKTHNNLEFNID